MRAAGHLHVQSQQDIEVLSREQAGAVTGEFGLALPLAQRRDQAPQPEAGGGHPAERSGQIQQVHQHRLIQRVPGHGVAHLVSDHHPPLVFVGQFVEPAAHSDERHVDAEGERVRERVVEHVELGPIINIEDRDNVVEQAIQVGELARPNSHGRGQERQPVLPFAQNAGRRPKELIEPGNRPHRGQGGAIGRMLERARADAGQDHPAGFVYYRDDLIW